MSTKISRMTVSSPKKKRVKQSSLSALEKFVICNIYKLVEEMGPRDHFIYSKEVAMKTAETTGVHVGTVYNVLKEQRRNKRVRSPKPAPKRLKTVDKLDELELCVIRRILHQFYINNDPPTIDKDLRVINEDDSLPNFKKDEHFIMSEKKLKIKYVNRSRRSTLIEKEESVMWQFHYLKNILKFKEEHRKIYYMHETRVNEGHTKSKVWQDLFSQSARHAYQERLSTKLKAPSGKGRRLIIVHIESEDGFLENGELIFESKKFLSSA